MPRRKTPAPYLPAISEEWLDQWVTGPTSPGEAWEIASAFKKALQERILSAELSQAAGGRQLICGAHASIE